MRRRWKGVSTAVAAFLAQGVLTTTYPNAPACGGKSSYATEA
jgi:hypothetical protein